MHTIQNMTSHEAGETARLVLLPQLRRTSALLPSQVCVVARVVEVQEHWLRLVQRAQRGNKGGEAVLALEGVQVLERCEVEWSLLARLGVKRMAHDLEWWPRTAHEPCSVRARFVIQSELAQRLGLRIDWEV